MAVVGAGPIGLAAAIDLATHGVRSVVLDDDDDVAQGSRAICWAKRSLEILDRLGVGERMRNKGVTWRIGRTYHRDRELFSVDLQPEPGHAMPAFVNLQQYYVEAFMLDRCADFPELIEFRCKNRVVGVGQNADTVTLSVDTPDGAYELDASFVLACDGARSSLRTLLGLELEGTGFEERFLIADVRLHDPMPAERRFWFEPTFHAGQSALLHKQPEDVYRIDLQLGADADPETERQPEAVRPRIRAVVGDRPFSLEWISIYSFQCRRLQRFVHGRIVFAGDSAHVVSPFGARGGNGGIQDVDNLVWKLALVLANEAPGALLTSYDEERSRAADENLRQATASTHFMTPKTTHERRYRDAVLDLAAIARFAQPLVNGGRLSTPCALRGLSLQTPAVDVVEGGLMPGDPCVDAPVGDGDNAWLLPHLGHHFKLLRIPSADDELAPIRIDDATGGETVALDDDQGLVRTRYGRGVTYLVRPDQHVAARFVEPDRATIDAAIRRATANDAGARDKPSRKK